MADCKIDKLLRSYTDPSSIKDRAPQLEAYQKILSDDTQLPDQYEEVFQFFTKQAVKDLKQPLVMTKAGLQPIYFPQGLPQGHHFAPKRHIAATGIHWEAYNPIKMEAKTSRYDDAAEFTTEEQVREAIYNDAYAFASSMKMARMMVSMLLLNTIDNAKKVGACKSDGTDGIMNEIFTMHFGGDATNGYQSHMEDLTLEQKFLPWKDDKPLSPCCLNSDGTCSATDCKPYKVTKHPFKESMECIQACLRCNKITDAKACSLKIFTQNGVGSEEFPKLIGMIQKIKEVVREMKTTPTSKYNICMNASDPAKCCTDANGCHEKCKTLGINIGCCVKCKDNTDGKCHCYNQTLAKTEDLALFISPKDVTAIEEAFPFIFNPSGLSITPENMGVAKIFVLDDIKSGEPWIVNRKTVGIHPVYDKTGSAFYPETTDSTALLNTWWATKFHIVIYPFQSVVVNKPS